jgi:hypothetical protein
MKFLSLITICLLMLILPFNVKVKAQVEIANPEQLNLDLTLIREDTNYNIPRKIVIAPVFYSNTDLSEDEIYRDTYFFTVDKLGFNDIPFHYLVGEDGKVFKGNSGADERRVRVEGIGEDMVLIGYMTPKNSGNFSTKAQQSLVQLAAEIANKNNINPSNISTNGIKFVRNQATRTVTIAQDNLFGNWQSTTESIKNQVVTLFNPIPKNYKLGISSVNLPTEGVNPGDQVTISINLNNVSPNGMYAGTDSEILISKTDSSRSNFFLNNIWVSNSQVSIMKEGDILLPFQQKTFEFNIRVPLFVGEVAETFELRTVDGRKIEANAFEVKINVNRTDKPIVEILSTETGTLNVRSEPSSVGSVLSQVSPGERFFVTNDAGNGWLEIDLGNDQRGWIAGWLTRQL